MRTPRAETLEPEMGTRQRFGLGLLCGAQFLVVLDMTIVTAALPVVRDDLGLSGRSVHWVMTAYAVTFGGFLIAAGRAADAYGRRRLLVLGAAIFTLASLACGLTPSSTVLLASRAVQGIGGALLSSAAFGMLVATFPAGRSRTRAMATWASTGSLGAVVGFVAGGALTELLGWRAIFLSVVPVGAVLAIAGRRLLPESRADSPVVVDLAAAALATVGVASLALLVTAGATAGPSEWTGAALVCAAVSIGLFVARERRSAQPLLPRELACDRSFVATGVVGIAYGSSVLGLLVLLALYLQVGRGIGALQAGLLLLLLRAPAIVWARLAGRLVSRVGPRPVVATACAAMAAGHLVCARLPTEDPFLTTLLPGLLVLGIAIPCLGVAVPTAALAGVRPDDAGIGSGLLTTFQWVGGSLGFAFVTAIAGTTSSAGSAGSAATVAYVHAGFVASAALCALALVIFVTAPARFRSTHTAAALSSG
jgi:EmrB/QacA subfamily drug resistance transporter